MILSVFRRNWQENLSIVHVKDHFKIKRGLWSSLRILSSKLLFRKLLIHYEKILYCKNLFSWKCENKTFLRLKLCLKLLLQTQTLLDASAKMYSDTGSELPTNFSKVLESAIYNNYILLIYVRHILCFLRVSQ